MSHMVRAHCFTFHLICVAGAKGPRVRDDPAEPQSLKTLARKFTLMYGVEPTTISSAPIIVHSCNDVSER